MQVKNGSLKFVDEDIKSKANSMYLFQFFIFLIWLSFGQVAVNPFGADEDDIDVKRLLENHIQVFILVYLCRFVENVSRESIGR